MLRNTFKSNINTVALKSSRNIKSEFSKPQVASRVNFSNVTRRKITSSALTKPFTLPNLQISAISTQLSSKRYVQMRMNPHQQQEPEKPALEEFGENITTLARENKLDPVIGMDDSIQRLLEILSRRTKNNPIIIGKAGTGKTTAINGLAQRIVEGQVPESLKNKEVISLELSKIVAGCKFRGEFEERLQKIIKEVDDKNGSVLLFIDEVHMLMGWGKSGDSAMDAANILKQKLAKGMRWIAVTT